MLSILNIKYTRDLFNFPSLFLFLLFALSAAPSLTVFLPAPWNFGVSEYLQNINVMLLVVGFGFFFLKDYHVI